MLALLSPLPGDPCWIPLLTLQLFSPFCLSAGDERVTLPFPPIALSFSLSLGILPADHRQLITATLWRGCFLSSCSGFYIWVLRPASQEGLMGNQSSGVVAALLEIVWTVSRRSPGLLRLSFSLSPPVNPLRACSSRHVTPSPAFIIPNNIPAVKALRKPPRHADVYLLSWPRQDTLCGEFGL